MVKWYEELDKLNKQFRDNLYAQIPELQRIKSNPNNFIIIKKWNNKILQRNKFNIFMILDEYITEEIGNKMKSMFNDFANIKEVQ